MTRYSEGYSKRYIFQQKVGSHLCLIYKHKSPINNKTFEEENKLAQLWFGHLGTKESNKRAIP